MKGEQDPAHFNLRYKIYMDICDDLKIISANLSNMSVEPCTICF